MLRPEAEGHEDAGGSLSTQWRTKPHRAALGGGMCGDLASSIPTSTVPRCFHKQQLRSESPWERS